MRNIFIRTIWKLAVFCGMGATLCACNDDLVNGLRTDYPDEDFAYHKNHVLWIVVDGASGTAVREANNDRRVMTLKGMMEKALYTFDGLADTRSDTLVGNRLGWENLLTGMLERSSDTPSVLEHLKALDGESRIAVLASEREFSDLCKDEADTICWGTDEQITKDAEAILSAKGEVPSLTIIEYNGVQQAGLEAGFIVPEGERAGWPTDEVIAALSETDQRIGRVMTALQARPDYSAEDWLVVVTSNYGGVADNMGENVYEMKDRNTFTLMYNERFGEERILAPSSDEGLVYKYFTPAYSGTGATDYAKVNDPSLFDFKLPAEGEDTTSYTVQFMVCYPNGGENWLDFVSKAIQTEPRGGEGWETGAEYFRLLSRFDGRRIWTIQDQASVLNDKKWHVLTVVFDYKKQQFRQYTDGHLDLHGNAEFEPLTVDVSTGDKVPLTIGQIFRSSTSTTVQIYVTNVQVYDVALPADFIAENYKLSGLDELGKDYPYWDNLIGYWPCDREEDYEGEVLPDYSQYGSIYGGVNAGKSDMTLSANVLWQQGMSEETNVKPPYSKTYFQTSINLVDIPFQTFQWLGFTVPDAWGWTGIGRTLPYKDLTTND